MSEEDYREERETNRARWEEMARLHVGSDHYDVEGFLAGETTLNSLEHEEVGDVVSALAGAGLRVEFLREFPHVPTRAWLEWPHFESVPGVEEDERGRWWITDLEHEFPLRFSVAARR